MSDLREWFLSIPIITRAWFAASIALPLIGRLGVVNPYLMLLSSDFLGKLHLWRPITATFYYPLSSATGFHYLLNLYFLYNYSKNLETTEFTNRPADYLFCLLFNWAALVLLGMFTNLYLLMDPLILSVVYIWCNLNAETIVSFWFGTRFQAKYLPWALFGMNLLMGSGGFYEILGILVGHLYFYVKHKYPADNGGVQLIDTPSILYKYLPSHSQVRTTTGFMNFNSFRTASSTRDQRSNTSGSASEGAPRSSGSSGGSIWGRGHVLGNR